MLKNRKKIIALFAVLVIVLQCLMPGINCYATEKTNTVENSVENNTQNEIRNEASNSSEENITQNETISNTMEESDVVTDNETEEKDIENSTDLENEKNKIEDNDIIEDEKIEESEDDLEVIENEDAGIMVATASGFGTRAGNENEFRNAFYNGGVSELTTSETIVLTSTYTLNHSLRIDSSSTTGSNALQLSSGCGIIVPNGCVLTLDAMVIDGRSRGNNDGKACITVQNGGVLMLIGHSIIDGRNKELGN